MTFSYDRKSIIIGIDTLRLTEEKNRQYYEQYIGKKYAEILSPIEIVFKASSDNTDE